MKTSHGPRSCMRYVSKEERQVEPVRNWNRIRRIDDGHRLGIPGAWGCVCEQSVQKVRSLQTGHMPFYESGVPRNI